MAAFRCGICSINYPVPRNVVLKGICERCAGPVSYFTNLDPDADWEAKVNEGREDKHEPKGWGPHPDNDSAPVVYHHDTDSLYVTDKELRSLGYIPEAFDVVKLNGKYYELLDYVAKSRVWRIESFAFTETAAAITAIPDTWERHDIIDLGDGPWAAWILPPPWERTDGDPED